MSVINSIKLPNGNKYNVSLPFLSDGFTTTAGSSTSGKYLATKWAVSGINGITTPEDGMTIAIRVPLDGTSGGVLLSINGGTTYYPIVRNVNTLVTTTYAVGSTIIVTFNSTQTAKPYVTAGTATTVTGCWQIADYDINTQLRVYRQDGSSYNRDYPLIASRTQASALGTVGTESSNEAVYGLISDTDANIPKTNPYTGMVKVKDLTASGTVTATSFSGNATSASKLGTDAGSATQPVYFSGGVPKATTYTLGASVPSCSTSNNGQFLRVVSGKATWSTVPNAEEASF